jgi:catalase
MPMADGELVITADVPNGTTPKTLEKSAKTPTIARFSTVSSALCD